MRKQLLVSVVMCMCAFVEAQAQVIRQNDVFWDGQMRYVVSIIDKGIYLNGKDMVRIIIGTLLKANYKKMNCFDVKNILESKNRALAGDTLPACGLYLNRIFYGELII